MNVFRGFLGIKGSRGVVKPTSLARDSQGPSSLYREAIIQARKEIYSVEGNAEKLKLATSLGITFLKEVISLVKVIPYGIHAYRTHRALIEHAVEQEGQKPNPGGHGRRSWWPWQTVTKPEPSIMRDIKYGPRERNLLDVYIPAASSSAKRPVLVFIHGGVWASGEKWQYSPLGLRVAQEGAIAVIISYTLFPQLLARDQAQEASSALTWTFDNIASYGGNPERVFLSGHSSGAHLASLVAWERVKDRILGTGGDTRQPYALLGLSGVYDIIQHYEYEESRGVALLSCMLRANGGMLGFPSMSPSLLLNALGNCLESSGDRGPQEAGRLRLRGHSSLSSSVLLPLVERVEALGTSASNPIAVAEDQVEEVTNGQAVDSLLVTEKERLRLLSQVEKLYEQATDAARIHRQLDRAASLGILGPSLGLTRLEDDELAERIADGFAVAAGAEADTPLWPPTVLFVSAADITVPPKTSLLLRLALSGIGARAMVVAYDDVGHGEFACWHADSARDSDIVKPLYNDVLDLLTGRVELESLDWGIHG